MKDFLDLTSNDLNRRWALEEQQIRGAVVEFGDATSALLEIFGEDRIARKQDSRSFNRAVFDALVFYASDPVIRAAMRARPNEVLAAYRTALVDREFLDAVESDTAGIPHTIDRLRIWGTLLTEALQLNFQIPALRAAQLGLPNARAGIDFSGFWI
jgi:hypothetical protein